MEGAGWRSGVARHLLFFGSLAVEKGVTDMVATSFQEAAGPGLSGRRKWGLMLPSSARASRVTYQNFLAGGDTTYAYLDVCSGKGKKCRQVHSYMITTGPSQYSV